MDFKFSNALGDSFTVTHSAEALQEMVKKYGIHTVYDYANGSSDADTEENIHTPEELVKEFPNVSLKAAKKYFAGEAEIYDIKIDGETYVISLCYPIPEIGYED